MLIGIFSLACVFILYRSLRVRLEYRRLLVYALEMNLLNYNIEVLLIEIQVWNFGATYSPFSFVLSFYFHTLYSHSSHSSYFLNSLLSELQNPILGFKYKSLLAHIQ